MVFPLAQWFLAARKNTIQSVANVNTNFTAWFSFML